MQDEELLSILSDENYINEIINANTCEKLQDILKSKNIVISHEDVKDIFNQIVKYKDNNLQQLTDNELLNLSGGKDWSTYRKVVTTVPYCAGYVVGRTPVIGLTIYSAIKGAKEQIKGIL